MSVAIGAADGDMPSTVPANYGSCGATVDRGIRSLTAPRYADTTLARLCPASSDTIRRAARSTAASGRAPSSEHTGAGTPVRPLSGISAKPVGEARVGRAAARRAATFDPEARPTLSPNYPTWRPALSTALHLEYSCCGRRVKRRHSLAEEQDGRHSPEKARHLQLRRAARSPIFNNPNARVGNHQHFSVGPEDVEDFLPALLCVEITDRGR